MRSALLWLVLVSLTAACDDTVSTGASEMSLPPDLLIPTSCSDGVKNGNETDVDCGGGVCPRCGAAKVCVRASDCLSALCPGGMCGQARCDDGVLNGSETDVDCGGPMCGACVDGSRCKAAGDCRSGACVSAVCSPTMFVDFSVPRPPDLAVPRDAAGAHDLSVMTDATIDAAGVDAARFLDGGAVDLAAPVDAATGMSDASAAVDAAMSMDLGPIDSAVARDASSAPDLSSPPDATGID